MLPSLDKMPPAFDAVTPDEVALSEIDDDMAFVNVSIFSATRKDFSAIWSVLET